MQAVFHRVLRGLDFLEERQPYSYMIALGLALGLRLLVVGMAPTWYSTDSHIYHGMGLAIVEGRPDSRLPNGLPLLEAGLRLALGEGVVQGVLVVNVLASVLACALVFLLARRYGGARTGWLALGLVVVYPHTLNYVRFELTETIATTLLLASFWGLARERFLEAGLALGLVWLFRSSAASVGLLVGLALVATPLARRRWRAVVRYVLGFAVVWGLHLGLVSRGVVQPPSNLEENVLRSITATSSAGIPLHEDNAPEALKDPWGTYFRFLWEHPGEWLRQRGSSLWELLGPWPSAGVGPTARGSAARLMIGLRSVLLLLALGAAWRLHRAWTLVLLVPLVGIAGVHMLLFSEPRFLVPVEPFLMVLGAAFCIHMLERGTVSPRVHRSKEPQ